MLNSAGPIDVGEVVRRMQEQGDSGATRTEVFVAFRRAVRHGEIKKVGTRYAAPGREAA